MFRRVFMSVVHPLAIMSAMFCVICSLLMFVSDASDDHMVETYSSMGFVMALYVAMIVSFCFGFEYLYCLACFCCCDFYVFVECEFVLRVSHSIFGLIFIGSVMLSICSSSSVLYFVG